MQVTVLGAGLVGLPIALELARNGAHDVIVADYDKSKLERAGKQGLKTLNADLQYPLEIKRAIENSGLVINAVPGHMGYNTLKAVIESGKNVVDIAFFPEDLFGLEELALKNKVVAVCDAGVAPGMSNILTAHSCMELDEAHSAGIYVGGLPKVRTWPWEYKAGFSPIDVIEEYTRTARFIRNGKLVEMPALTGPEFLEFEKIGTLEAFNSDGLRSLMKTLKVPDMVEKTLRYPGHREKMLALREAGFFDNRPREIAGAMVRPLDVTTELLFPQWKLKEDEADFTVMRIIVEGCLGRQVHRITWDLYDEYDPVTGIHSMARTTGYTATGIAEMILGGRYTVPGIHPPEDLAGDPGLVDHLLKYLEERNIIYRKSVETRDVI